MPPANERFDPRQFTDDDLCPPAPDWAEAAKDPANRVVLLSRAKLAVSLAILIAAFLFLAPTAILVFLVFPILGGFIGLIAALCALCILIAPLTFFDRSPKLVFTEGGLFDNTDEVRFIGWLRILEADLVITKNAPFPASHALHLTLIGRGGIESTRKIPLDDLTMRPHEIAAEIDRYVEDRRRRFLKRTDGSKSQGQVP